MKFNECNYDEQRTIAKMFEKWLSPYTQEVIVRVMEKREEILNDDFAMNLIKELYERELKEEKRRVSSITCLFEDFEKFKEYDIHIDCVSHSKSYRDVLYDMYIGQR